MLLNMNILFDTYLKNPYDLNKIIESYRKFLLHV